MLLLHKHPDVHELESRRDIRKLVKALHFPGDPQVRVSAAEALGRVGDAGAVSSLIEALGDDAVRPAAIRALGLIGDPYAVASLASLLDTAAGEPTEVCGALACIGAPAVDALGKQLTAPNARVRAAATEALGQIGERRAIRNLTGGLHDPVAAVRAATAGALDVLGWTPPSIEEAMTYRVAHREWDRCVRASAIKPLIAVLGDDDPDVVHGASKALGRIGAAAVDPLIAALDTSPLGASDALVAIGVPAIDALRKALSDERLDVREAAADVLDRIGWEPREDDAAYWVARRDWDKCRDETAVEPLRLALQQGEAEAADALVRIGGPEARAALRASLMHRQKMHAARHVVEFVVNELGRDLDPLAVDPLIDVLNDRWEDIGARRAAARALVALHQSGRLDDATKQKIVAQREVITYEEPDWDEERFGNARGPDESIGVDFPL